MWRHRNAENEEMDGQKKQYMPFKQHVTENYEIWQSWNLPSEYLRSYICFHEELVVKQEENDSTIIGLRLRDVIRCDNNK
jgi:hypothetical protein